MRAATPPTRSSDFKSKTEVKYPLFLIAKKLTGAYPIANIKYMNNLSYNLIFRPEPEGGFTVTVPALQGCVTYGKNLKQAKSMALDAIAGYIASLKKHGQPIPYGMFVHS